MVFKREGTRSISRARLFLRPRTRAPLYTYILMVLFPCTRIDTCATCTSSYIHTRHWTSPPRIFISLVSNLSFACLFCFVLSAPQCCGGCSSGLLLFGLYIYCRPTYTFVYATIFTRARSSRNTKFVSHSGATAFSVLFISYFIPSPYFTLLCGIRGIYLHASVIFTHHWTLLISRILLSTSSHLSLGVYLFIFPHRASRSEPLPPNIACADIVSVPFSSSFQAIRAFADSAQRKSTSIFIVRSPDLSQRRFCCDSIKSNDFAIKDSAGKLTPAIFVIFVFISRVKTRRF